MTTNPTTADLAQKPSDRIMARAREKSLSQPWGEGWRGEEWPHKYTLAAILEYLDEQAAPANRAASPSGEVDAPSPVERAKYIWVCSALGCGREIASAGTCAEHKPEQDPKAEATPLDPTDRDIRDKVDVGVTSRERPLAPADDIIRAAEGVTLEPGEYEIVAIQDRCPKQRVGDRLTVAGQLRPILFACWVWRVESAQDREHTTLVTAVRCVSPAEPEPVPESGGECERLRIIEKLDVNMASLSRLELEKYACGLLGGVDELRSKVRDQNIKIADLSSGLAQRTSERDTSRACDQVHVHERNEQQVLVTELRSKVSELESERDRLVKQTWDLGTRGDEAEEERDKLRSTLAVTEAKLSQAQEHIETLYNNARLFQDDFNLQVAAVAERDAELARLREELATAARVCDQMRDAVASALASVETPAVAAPAEAQREIAVGQIWRGDCGEIDCTGKHVVTNVQMKSGRQSVSFECGDLRIGASAGRFRDNNEPVCVELVRPATAPRAAIPDVIGMVAQAVAEVTPVTKP